MFSGGAPQVGAPPEKLQRKYCKLHLTLKKENTMSEEEHLHTDMLPLLAARLDEEELTCIIKAGDRILTSKERGIRPLLEWIAAGEDVSGASAADKIVGKAAALLYVFMGVKEVWAEVLSESGLGVLRAHGIRAEYATLTPRIVNRAGTGMCPMEETVLSVSDPAEALDALRKTSARLREQAAHGQNS